MISAITDPEKTVWKMINMRSVRNLLGAELLHQLYNQHIPRINAIRFSNTKIVWHNGIAKSYAPETEWNALIDWVSIRFSNNDELFLAEISALLRYSRTPLNKKLSAIKKQRLEELSNVELGLSLIDLQHFVFQEIYPVNLVQLEYSITHAIGQQLAVIEPHDSKRSLLLSTLLNEAKDTAYGREESAFRKIVSLGRRLNCPTPLQSNKVLSLLRKHCDAYRFMHCAYGEDPRDFDFYIKRYKEAYESIDTKARPTNHKEIPIFPKNETSHKLIKTMKKIGDFRDKNKALLGQTMRYKYAILEEIDRRKLEERKSLNFYLLDEILHLLKYGEKVSADQISLRETKGVVLSRREHLEMHRLVADTPTPAVQELRGVCASPGTSSGTCRLILKKDDISKMKRGDIMVAIGTDFDLMEAIELADAVITEEGGLLSHASVVCREMKKPCCIAVLNATKILKDEDRITVNATDGIIKIRTT